MASTATDVVIGACLQNTQGDSDYEFSDSESFKKELGGLLQNAFGEDDDSNYKFAGSGLLSDFPLPGLHIEGVGSVGLPLSSRDADVIKSVYAATDVETAPAGGSSPLNVWRVPDSYIKTQNPAWGNYVGDKILSEALDHLNVSSNVAKVQLGSLFLLEEGATLNFEQVKSECPDAFGSLLIDLPSLFTGGHIVVSHTSLNFTFHTAPYSAFGTSFTCFYHEVLQTVGPVVSGRRLALLYHLLLKDTDCPRPCPPVLNRRKHRLKGMLKAWAGRVGQGCSFEDTPRFVAHILDKYYKNRLSFQSLRGDDVAKVAFLRAAAADLNFIICLADMEASTDEPEEDYASEEEDEETSSSLLQHVITPNGLRYDLSHIGMTPADVLPTFDLDHWKPNNKYVEGYRVHKDYSRTVVVFWPQQCHLSVVMHGMPPDRAAEQLERSIDEYTTTNDRHALLDMANAVPLEYECIPTLVRASIVLEDYEIFKKVMCCDAKHAMTPALCVDVVRTFGFLSVQSWLDDLLNEEIPSVYDSFDGPYGRAPLLHNRAIQKRSDILDGVLKAYSTDPLVMNWANHHQLDWLASSEALDNDALDKALVHANQIGFERAQSSLDVMVQTLIKSAIQQHESLIKQRQTRRGRRTAFFDESHVVLEAALSTLPDTFLTRCLQSFAADRDCAEWCASKVLEGRSTQEGLTSQEVSVLVRVLETSVNALPDYVPFFLTKLELPTYSPTYLAETMHPFVDAAGAMLADKSMSFWSPGLGQFTERVLFAAAAIWSTVPTGPTNYSLPSTSEIYGFELDSFLKSSVRHVFELKSWERNTKEEEMLKVLEKQGILECHTGALQMQTFSVAFQKVVQSSMPRVAFDGPLDSTTRVEWQAAVDSCGSCEDCRVMQSCMEWSGNRAKLERLIEAFGVEPGPSATISGSHELSTLSGTETLAKGALHASAGSFSRASNGIVTEVAHGTNSSTVVNGPGLVGSRMEGKRKSDAHDDPADPAKRLRRQ